MLLMLTIYNSNGQRVGAYAVNGSASAITVDSGNFPGGMYYYSIAGEGIAPISNKMIISR